MVERKPSKRERLGDYLIGGCQRASKTDKPQSKCLKENGPRIPLAGVKTDLFNPVQRTLRRYDIENVQGKLAQELSRNTFPLKLVGLLQNSNDHRFMPPQIIYPGYDLLPLTQCNPNQDNDEVSTFLKNRDISDTWKTYIDSLPLSKTKITTNNDFNFHNYVVKYARRHYQPCCTKR